MTKRSRPAASQAAFTILEVMVAALLIALATGSIMAMNAKAIQTLHATGQAAASSQILQQRIEMIRSKPWPEISNSTALAGLMQTATESEKELADTGFRELMKVSVPSTASGEISAGSQSFTIRRERGRARIDEAGDLGAEPVLLLESSLTWRDYHGPHERRLRTVICRAGLTRSGVFGSALGRP